VQKREPALARAYEDLTKEEVLGLERYDRTGRRAEKIDIFGCQI
jgi:hypothetical protein